MDDDQYVVADDVVVAVGSYVPAARLGQIRKNPFDDVVESNGIMLDPAGVVGVEYAFTAASRTPTMTVVMVGDTLPIGIDVPLALLEPLPLPAVTKAP